MTKNFAQENNTPNLTFTAKDCIFLFIYRNITLIYQEYTVYYTDDYYQVMFILYHNNIQTGID